MVGKTNKGAIGAIEEADLEDQIGNKNKSIKAFFIKAIAGFTKQDRETVKILESDINTVSWLTIAAEVFSQAKSEKNNDKNTSFKEQIKKSENLKNLSTKGKNNSANAKDKRGEVIMQAVSKFVLKDLNTAEQIEAIKRITPLVVKHTNGKLDEYSLLTEIHNVAKNLEEKKDLPKNPTPSAKEPKVIANSINNYVKYVSKAAEQSYSLAA